MTFLPAIQPLADAPPRPRTWFAVGSRGLLVRRDETAVSTPRRWLLPRTDDLESLGVALGDAYFFGRWGDSDAFALSIPETTTVPDGWSLLGIRGLVEAFDEETFALAGRASHVLDWATTSRFCGRCGSRTERVPTEWCMRCPSCALTMYPRIAPAIIVLVRKGDQALLARNARFPVPFFSTLAGFSEIGESLEETVKREVLEEVGVCVKDLRYVASQPWPFPHSLMLGFTAEWESGDIVVDNEEIAEARWYASTELPLVPPRLSIARRLIDAWVDEVRARP